MLVSHPRIYLDARGNTTDALLVEHGQVVAIGGEARRRHQGTPTLEPEAACLFPGLIDAHIHLWGLGLRAGSVSLRHARATDDVYQALRDYDLNLSPSGWVLATDWDQHQWRDRPTLDLAELDRIWPDTPVSLRRVDGHALWVNSEAMRRAGIDESWDPGPGGHLGRDAHERLNGLLVDDAMNPVLDATPQPDVVEDRATFLRSCQMLLGFGITGAHKAWMPVDRLSMLEALRDLDQLPLRLHLLFDGNDPDLGTVLERGPRRDPWISATGIKFFADGAMGSRGAAMLDPYLDGTLGLTIDGREHLLEKIPALAWHGWQVAVHAIGDRGARNVLDAFAAIDDEARGRTRPRLEHAQIMHPDDVERLRGLGVIASIQPIHLYSDAAWAHEVLHPHQLERLYRWRELACATRVCAGSDYPIEDANPWHGIATGLTRAHRGGDTFNPDQALTLHELLAAYTHEAAFAAGMEDRVGALHPGYFADFIALERDPFQSTPQEIWDMGVLKTFVAGQDRTP